MLNRNKVFSAQPAFLADREVCVQPAVAHCPVWGSLTLPISPGHHNLESRPHFLVDESLLQQAPVIPEVRSVPAQFPTASSPVSCEALPQPGHPVSQPTCLGLTHAPSACRWPAAVPISTSPHFASRCEHVHLGQKPNGLAYFTEQPGLKQLMLHYQWGPHQSSSLVTSPLSYSQQTKQKTLWVSEELVLFQLKTHPHSLSSNIWNTFALLFWKASNECLFSR